MFDRVLSLGWFCSPALEIRRIGYRDSSYPFDWLLSHDFSMVVNMISRQSLIHLYTEDMLQYKGDPSKWYNKRFVISMFHDFDKYKRLIDQIDDVNTKYLRRGERFYKVIKSPTLFIRYIKNEEKVNYIKKNENYILMVLKKYNEKNSLIFVANSELKSCVTSIKSAIYYVEPDEHDYVAREFLKKIPALEEYIINTVKQPENRYKQKRSILRLNKWLLKFKKVAINDNEIHQDGMLEKVHDDEIVLFYKKNECSGCGACQAICPKGIITMELIDDFYYPIIKKEGCIKCKQCMIVCPFK